MADNDTQETSVKENACADDDGQKRVPRYTEKGLEDLLQRQISLRRVKLSHVTAKLNKINGLMTNNEDPDTVDEHLNEFAKLMSDFDQSNKNVLQLLSEEEKNADQAYWYQPKCEKFSNFVMDAEKWTIDARQQQQDSVGPDDSASSTGAKGGKRPGSCTSGARSSRCGSTASTSSSAHRKEQAERASLIAKAEKLKEKQALEMEELQLKARKEQLEIETQIAASTAKINVLKEYEDGETRSVTYKYANSVSNVQQSSLPPVVTYELSNTHSNKPHHHIKRESPRQNVEMENKVDLCEVMLKQNYITEMLVKQQRLTNLPQRDVPIFSGDPLEFKPFLRAFDHTISSKTDNDSDKIYYLEQFTRGEPKELVKSCQHMSPERGYREAMKLLHYHYGNEIKIAAAYLNKAVNWPQVKADDAKTLHSYSLFLTSCNNAMQDINHLEELDNPTNLRVIVSKLPYKMREKWRVCAFDIQESSGRRAKFSDLVKFLNRQAKIASDPLFGDIKDASDRGKQYSKSDRTFRPKGSAFATSVAPATKEKLPDAHKGTMRQTTDAFQRPCVYCEKGHSLADCQKIRRLPHKEKVDFLKGKGLCFSCLTQGHLSRDCKKRIQCDYCSKRHPSMLHYARSEDVAVDNKLNDDAEKADAEAPSPTTITGGTCGATGAGNSSRVLAIVPVHVKLKKSSKTIDTYAFLDNGSGFNTMSLKSGHFCMKSLDRQHGKCFQSVLPHRTSEN